MPSKVLICDVAAEHGFNTEYATKLFRKYNLPIERTRSPRSNRWCNCTTPEGAAEFDRIRADLGFHKLGQAVSA